MIPCCKHEELTHQERCIPNDPFNNLHGGISFTVLPMSSVNNNVSCYSYPLSCRVHSSPSTTAQVLLSAPADTAPVRLLTGMMLLLQASGSQNERPTRHQSLQKSRKFPRLLGSFLSWLNRGVCTSCIPNFFSRSGVSFAPPQGMSLNWNWMKLAWHQPTWKMLLESASCSTVEKPRWI